MKLADQIRSMTDFEMAEFFANRIFNGMSCENCPVENLCKRRHYDDDCVPFFVDWLQSEGGTDYDKQG